MTRYADPSRCPDCRAALSSPVVSCPGCGLTLQHPLAVELLTTLTHADELLARLRAAAPVATPVVTPVVTPVPPSARTTGTTRPARPPRRRALSGASVPQVLLGLGALCLLVAAVIFLAVAWSWLGVGGRTAVLAALTLVAGAAGAWFARRGLRVAGEALTTVGLGLLVLDFLGAAASGWFGGLEEPAVVSLTGSSVAAAGLGLAVLTARLPGGRGPALVAPQLAAAAGLWTAVAGGADLTGAHRLLGLSGAAVLVGLAVVGRVLGLRVLPYAALAAGCTWWGWALLDAVDGALLEPSVAHVWREGAGPTLVTCALLALLPGATLGLGSPVRRAAGATASSLFTVAVLLPAVDEGLTVGGSAAAAALLVWSAAAAVLPERRMLLARVPQLLVGLPVAGVALELLAVAAERLAEVGPPSSRHAAVRLPASPADAEPVLLPALVVVLLVAVGTAYPAWADRVRALSGPATGLAAVGALALLPVPLATVAGACAVVGLATTAYAVRRPTALGTGAGAAGAAVGSVAVLAALPVTALTAATAAVLLAGAALVLARARFPFAPDLAGLVLPAAAAVATWSVAELAGTPTTSRAVPVLLVLGLLAAAVPRPAAEASAAVAALTAWGLAMPLTADLLPWLALHLTLAGALVVLTALVNRTRRRAAWLGGLLLASGSWVRLVDLEVEAVEAYTLPTALVLVAVGGARLRRDPLAQTSTTLRPGLVLATLPSLVQVAMTDPASLRAALLGAACLALVLLGAALRWHAPLVVGAAAGAALVLLELAPYAGSVPQWLLIGAAGTVLTVVGVTWERRLQDLGRAADYLGRLR